jgi:hypothetical protein
MTDGEVDPVYGRIIEMRDGVTTVRSGGRQCSSGGHGRFIGSADFDAYFRGDETRCPTCDEPEPDLWAAVDEFPFEPFNGLAGACRSAGSVPLLPGSNEIALSTLGVPDDARVLNAIVMPGPAPEVLEEWMRDPLGELGPETREQLNVVAPVSSFDGEVPHVLSLVGQEPANAALMPTVVSISVSWIATTDRSLPWRLLADAVVALERHQPTSVAIWACTAVEAAVYDLADRALASSHIGKDRREPFLQDRATFSWQLNVLLPLIFDLTSVPPMSDELRKRLNTIRKTRNQLAHGNDVDVTGDARMLLKSAVFGLHFLRFASALLDAQRA